MRNADWSSSEVAEPNVEIRIPQFSIRNHAGPELERQSGGFLIREVRV